MARMHLSRVAFCPCCKKEGRPHSGDWLVLYGGERKGFFYHKIEYHVRSKRGGFTPHIFLNNGFISNDSAIMEIETFCGVIGCERGVILVSENQDGSWNWAPLKPERIRMNLKEWDDLINFTDTGYELH